MNRTTYWRRWRTPAAVLAAVLATAVACTSSSADSDGGNSAPGADTNTVTVAQVPNATINFILPFPDPTHLSPSNLPWYEMMYRPLYWFGKNGKPVLNPEKSLAKPPQYSADRKTVTIKMKHWKWSNGDPITAKNVMFWINMAKANKDKLGIYSPGYIPDNIKSAEVTAKDTIVLHLDKAYNKQWFTFSQLSQVWVFPDTWDVTGKGQPANCSTDRSDCKAVYKYLYKQAENTKTYDTNPLWQNVSGPWKVKHFEVQGDITMVPNENYSGPDKPKIDKYVMKAFTSASAEYNVLRKGTTLDVGYIPLSSIQKPRPPDAGVLEAGPNPVSDNYKMIVDLGGYGPSSVSLNYNSPKMGAVFKQLYFRQALASTINQQALIQKLYKGYGYPTYSAVPLYPKSQWVPDIASKKNYPYKFDLNRAKKLLSDNGWKVNPGGVSTCVNPGTGAGQCGKGIPKGKKLAFQFIYFSGSVTTKTLASTIKSNASKVGIDVTLHPMPGQLIQTIVRPCKPADCKWDTSTGGWQYVYYPSGEQIFNTGAFANFGSFSNPKVDKLIAASHTSAGNEAMLNYATATTKLLPNVWMPHMQNLGAYAKGLKGYLPEAQGPYSFPVASELYFAK